VKKIKVGEASGVVLDYLVAISLGGEGFYYDTLATWWINVNGKDRALSKGWAQSFNPSTDWNHGGPIIDELGGTMWSTNASGWRYRAPYDFTNDKEGPTTGGPTPLIAAMRCFVASKLGEDVEVPDELLK
jgi:hypothetical protein